jgi:hypothetical protein
MLAALRKCVTEVEAVLDAWNLPLTHLTCARFTEAFARHLDACRIKSQRDLTTMEGTAVSDTVIEPRSHLYAFLQDRRLSIQHIVMLVALDKPLAMNSIRVVSRSGFIPLMKVCSRFLAVGERCCGNVSCKVMMPFWSHAGTRLGSKVREEYASDSDCRTIFCSKECGNFLQVVEKIRPPDTPFLNLQSHCLTKRIHS